MIAQRCGVLATHAPSLPLARVKGCDYLGLYIRIQNRYISTYEELIGTKGKRYTDWILHIHLHGYITFVKLPPDR